MKVTLKWLDAHYTKTEVMIPMRDGVRLYTAIYASVDRPVAPLLLMRTPFQLKPYGPGRMDRKLRTSLAEFVKAGYIIALQNVRGTYMSEGDFVNIRPDGKEQEDCHDTVEWLLEHSGCDGNVGVKGMSYPGFYALEAAICNHPAIKAVSPQAPVTDWFLGDDLHHNGALMLNDCYGFGRFFFRDRKKPGPKALPTRHEECDDIYSFFLKKGALGDILSPYSKKNGFWRDLCRHPHMDEFWKDRNAARRLSEAESLPPMLIVGGTFDAEDCHGPLACADALAGNPHADNVYMVLGPWAHGSWLHSDYDHLAGVALGDGLSEWFLKNIEFPFFSHFLEGKGPAPASKVQVFPSRASAYAPDDVMSDNMVICSDEWPLEFTRKVRLVPCEGRRLECTDGLPGIGSSDCQIFRECSFSYVSDPWNPVPATEAAAWISRDHMAADQSFLKGRKDVLTFTGKKLRQAICALGKLRVRLKLKCSSTDADMVVKLIDCREDGYRMQVRSDIFPLRYRNSFSKPEALNAGEVTVVEFEMPDIAHIFEAGHRIIVQVQSSCYPLYAMSPQTYLENPMNATVQDYCKASIEIICGGEDGSYVEMNVL